MDYDDEIQSPPYPRDSPTTKGVYSQLQELREWLLAELERLPAGEREWEADEPGDAPPDEEPRELPDYHIFEALGVVIHADCVREMRQVRECWDHIIRLFEDAWATTAAAQARWRLLQHLTQYLNGIFVDSETREAHRERAIKRMQRLQRKVGDYLQEIVNEVDDEDDDDEEEEDFYR